MKLMDIMKSIKDVFTLGYPTIEQLEAMERKLSAIDDSMEMEKYELSGFVTAKQMTRREMNMRLGIDAHKYPILTKDSETGFFVVINNGNKGIREEWYSECQFHEIFVKVK